MSTTNDFVRWYRAGTVAVTNGSNAVVGTGTVWAAGVAIRPGDLFSLDGTKFYEIDTITDDTHLTLLGNFAGSTASGQNYFIIRNFSVTPAADLIGTQIELVTKSLNREIELLAWQTAADVPPPGTPATVTLHAYSGTATTIKSLPQILGDINRAIAAGNVGPAGPVGPTGPAGTAGPGANPRGPWATAIAYAKADVVFVNPHSYVCTTAHTSSALTMPASGANWATVWSLYAEGVQGPTGPMGAIGPVGPTGPQGLRGATWFATVGVPLPGVGLNGDYAFDAANGNVYLKAGGTWSLSTNITGPIGPTGLGITWRAAWATATVYSVGNAVSDLGIVYYCKTAHTSDSTSHPGVGGSWATYWSVMLQPTPAPATNGLPVGGALNNIPVKTGSGDYAVGWVDYLPPNTVHLYQQDWTSTSLAQLAVRSYSDLTSRPADDNFSGLSAAIASDYSSTPFTNVYLPVHENTGGYKKMNVYNFGIYLARSLDANASIIPPTDNQWLGYQRNNNVSITGGTISGVDFTNCFAFGGFVAIGAQDVQIDNCEYVEVVSSGSYNLTMFDDGEQMQNVGYIALNQPSGAVTFAVDVGYAPETTAIPEKNATHVKRMYFVFHNVTAQSSAVAISGVNRSHVGDGYGYAASEYVVIGTPPTTLNAKYMLEVTSFCSRKFSSGTYTKKQIAILRWVY